MDAEGVSAVKDAVSEEAHRGGLRSEMHMKVTLSIAAHPLADHQGFGQIGEVQEQAAEVGSGESNGQSESAQVAGEIEEKSFSVRRECAGNAMRLHAIGSGGFVALVGGEFFRRTIGRVDGRGIDTKSKGAQGQYLAQNEGHGEIGVAADQVGDGRRSMLCGSLGEELELARARHGWDFTEYRVPYGGGGGGLPGDVQLRRSAVLYPSIFDRVPRWAEYGFNTELIVAVWRRSETNSIAGNSNRLRGRCGQGFKQGAYVLLANTVAVILAVMHGADGHAGLAKFYRAGQQ